MSKNFIRTAYLESARNIFINDTITPHPGSDEVLIRPILTAICGSDVSFFQGHRIPSAYPIVLGHEVVGNIVATGDNVTDMIVGQRVIVEPNYPCGKCKFCQCGNGNICASKRSLGVTIPGCYAELFCAPAEFCWPIPDAISDADAVTIEPLTVSLHALWQSGVKMGDTISVLGCGSTGLLLIQAAKMQGARIIAHDVVKNKMELAHQIGAEISDRQDLAQLWQEKNVTTVFECAGSPATVELALNSAPRGSEIILMGLSSSQASFQPLRFVREGLHMSGSLIYDHPSDFEKAISLVKEKRLSPKSIVSATFSFEKIQDAMQVASTGEAGKILLDMQG